ncbi:tRNA (adenosine(37)-N6)-threonylcarbamoyltransferase complex ATPase subunit type 1 TsaE, partial [Nocardiopsis alba]|uniref:tRNA (adenosine(37)-N6)-threonylcarbamoyltransferase complex ATPase subunit type 1 TsaE n=1 Tax=Nocardiopsis alba TaxID=53437 RepID=UPI00340B9831
MTDTTATTAGVSHVHTVTAATDDAMRTLGRDLAALARPGDLLILSGPLGAGKTTFTQGLGEGLGVRGAVTSPTFIISRIHPSLAEGPALVHVDAYRLGGPEEIDDIDLDMTLPDSVTVVEWGEGVAEGPGGRDRRTACRLRSRSRCSRCRRSRSRARSAS